VAGKYFKLILSSFYPTSIMYLRFSLHLGDANCFEAGEKKGYMSKALYNT
jgi:hypothetical protein